MLAKARRWYLLLKHVADEFYIKTKNKCVERKSQQIYVTGNCLNRSRTTRSRKLPQQSHEQHVPGNCLNRSRTTRSRKLPQRGHEQHVPGNCLNRVTNNTFQETASTGHGQHVPGNCLNRVTNNMFQFATNYVLVFRRQLRYQHFFDISKLIEFQGHRWCKEKNQSPLKGPEPVTDNTKHKVLTYRLKHNENKPIST
jgi:hypothetical protein